MSLNPYASQVDFVANELPVGVALSVWVRRLGVLRARSALLGESDLLANAAARQFARFSWNGRERLLLALSDAVGVRDVHAFDLAMGEGYESVLISPGRPMDWTRSLKLWVEVNAGGIRDAKVLYRKLSRLPSTSAGVSLFRFGILLAFTNRGNAHETLVPQTTG
jgi:hypothetical protein